MNKAAGAFPETIKIMEDKPIQLIFSLVSIANKGDLL
jgi:hypothetical protein